MRARMQPWWLNRRPYDQVLTRHRASRVTFLNVHRDTRSSGQLVGGEGLRDPVVEDADPFVTWWAGSRDDNGPAPTPEQIKAGRRGGLTAVPNTTAGGQR